MLWTGPILMKYFSRFKRFDKTYSLRRTQAVVLLESHNYNLVISLILLLFSPGTGLNVIKWFTSPSLIRWFALVLVSLCLFRHFIVSHNLLTRCWGEIYDFPCSIEIWWVQFLPRNWSSRSGGIYLMLQRLLLLLPFSLFSKLFAMFCHHSDLSFCIHLR